MAIPAVNISVVDGALGLVPLDAGNSMICFGVSSLGTVNVVQSFASKEAVKTALGVGPLVEAICHKLDIAGGSVLACPVTSSVAGSNSAVTQVGTGPAVTLTGTPNDDYQGLAQVVLGGAVGTATFKISLDGGDTYSPDIATASTYALDASSPIGHATGITLNFAAGTYVAGTTYAFTSTAPGYSTANLNTAFDAAIADSRVWSMAHVVGLATTVSGCASVVAAVQTKMTSASNAFRYARAFVDCPADTDANIIAGFAAVTAPNVSVGTGFHELLSPIRGRFYSRPQGWTIAAKALKAPISEDIGRFASGAVVGVLSLSRDERATPGLADARLSTMRTYAGNVPGFYVTDARLLSGVTSDYKYLQHGRVMDRACSVAYTALLQFLNSTVRVTPVTGLIDEGDARAIDSFVQAQLDAALTSLGHASACSARVIRTDNILSTATLRIEIRVTPLGYLKQIAATIGFLNPALALN